MSTAQLLAITAPAVALLLAAVLEVAWRAASRRDVHRWAQRTLGDDADEGASWEHIDETFTAIRLAQQLSLVFVVVVISTLGPGWFGAGGIASRLAWAAGLALGAYLLVEPAEVGELVEGSIVVARVDGGPSFYQFSKNGKGILLTSPEGKSSPKAIDDPEKLHLIGRVVALYRRLDGASILVSATAH